MTCWTVDPCRNPSTGPRHHDQQQEARTRAGRRYPPWSNAPIIVNTTIIVIIIMFGLLLIHPSDTGRQSQVQVAWLFEPPLCESGRAVAGWQEGVLGLLRSSDNAGKYLKMLKKIFEDIWPACMHRVGQTLPCKCAYCWSDYKPPCWRGVGLIKLKLRPEVWQASLKNKVKPSYFNTWGPIVLFVDYFWSIVIVFAREWRVHSAWALKQISKVNKIWEETIQDFKHRAKDW